MSRSSPRITLIERPIDEPIEKHRGGACADHAKEHEKQCSSRRQAIRRHNECAQGKRQRKNRVRETDQLQKTTERIARWRFVLKMSILRRHGDLNDLHPTTAANARLPLRESVIRERKEFAPRVSRGVGGGNSSFVFRSGNIFAAGN